MNTKLGPYPKYKDSGIPWLGQIPEHWDVRRNGRLFAQRNETGFGELPILEVSLRTGVRIRDMDNLKRKQVMSDAEKYKRAAKGDIAYNMMRMWQGALGTAPVDGLVSPAYVVARPFEETNPHYYSYLFRTEGYKAEVDGYSRGIVKDRNRLYWQDFKRMPSCFPPPEEQAAIVRFLDANAALVRQYVRNRRNIIEALLEQKKAIIDRAVTRGLGTNTAMKSSGLPWLSDIPQHWNVTSLRHLASKFGSGVTPSGGGASYLDEGIALLRSQNIQFEGIQMEGVARISRSTHDSLRSTHIKEGDVLLNITGASIGRVCAVPKAFEEANVNQHVCIIRPIKNLIIPEYLAAYLSSGMMQRNIRLEQNGASREGLGLDAIRAFKIALPPISEQTQIVQVIKSQTSEITKMLDVTKMEIQMIMELRASVITAAVKGELDLSSVQFPIENIDFADDLDCDFDEDIDGETHQDMELTNADD